MYGIGFVIAVLAVSGLVVLVGRLLGWITGRLVWWVLCVLWGVLALVSLPGRVLRILRVLRIWLRLLGLGLLGLILRLSRRSTSVRENCMAGVAILAVDGVAGMAGWTIDDKRISAVGAYPLSPQVLCAALRAGSC